MLLTGGFWSFSFPPPGVICTPSNWNVLISSVRGDMEELFICNNFLRSYFGRLGGRGVGVKNSLYFNLRSLFSNHKERVTCIMFGAIISGIHYLARSDFHGSVLFTFWGALLPAACQERCCTAQLPAGGLSKLCRTHVLSDYLLSGMYPICSVPEPGQFHPPAGYRSPLLL